MELTPDAVAAERDWVRRRAAVVVPIINEVRTDLGEAFGTSVDPVTESRFREEVDEVFADGDVAVNAAALVGLLRDLDVAGDWPGFIVDEVLGRELAAIIAGGTPLDLLAQATFHYADIVIHTEGAAGADDLDAALAAGFQTRLPGWSWRKRDNPFGLR